MKSLDAKLNNIRDGSDDPSNFIIADAKDGDMAFGLAAPGPRRDASGQLTEVPKTRGEYLAAMRQMVESGTVDVMLTSASNGQVLAEDGLFAASPVTLAVRVNDTSDIWLARGATYAKKPSRPFRSARLSAVRRFADLGLYSLTFVNDLKRDLASLEAYRAFREEADAMGMRHFLEVFNPNVDIGLEGDELGHYVGDMILKALAGTTREERPLFLKIAFNGARSLSELAVYDPELVVGILGGSKGTTRDTFELVHQAYEAGARVALFGRKINLAESPVELVRLMRSVAEVRRSPTEAVRDYHEHLETVGLAPDRKLKDDLKISDPLLEDGA